MDKKEKKTFFRREVERTALSESGINEGGGGAIRNRKTVEKIIQNRKTEKPKKTFDQTENRTRNCQRRYIFASQLLKPRSIQYSGDKWSIQSNLN